MQLEAESGRLERLWETRDLIASTIFIKGLGKGSVSAMP